MAKELPRYRVLATTFHNAALVEAGAEIEFDGPPADNLEPLNDAAKKAKAAVQGNAGTTKPETLQAGITVGAGERSVEDGGDLV